MKVRARIPAPADTVFAPGSIRVREGADVTWGQGGPVIGRVVDVDIVDGGRDFEASMELDPGFTFGGDFLEGLSIQQEEPHHDPQD